MKLVIVESPAKAKTISKILSKEFVVESSIGHIRDLPKSASDIPAKYKKEKWARLGIDIENDFAPLYVISSEKKKQIKKLKDLLKKATELYLATDEDREGEAISWHLLEVLNPKKITIKRLAFHEITKEAIHKALDNPREIDTNLVSAQETRRILDRLYGYELSPILWRKVAPKLSAGRVQSVALKIIIEREKERIAFKKANYFSLVGEFQPQEIDEKIEATLKQFQNEKVAIGKDFDSTTGLLKTKKVLHLNESNIAATEKLLNSLDYIIDNIETKPVKSSPYAPFITSTLQQEGNNKLGLSSKETMQVAQKLYENGYITYMRTDSINLSHEAITASRKIVENEYGKEYLPDKPRIFKSKVKNAQEAHEAIRPAGTTFQSPKQLKSKLSEIEYKLYKLIYTRTIASQMQDAITEQTTIKIVSTCKQAEFQANGKTILFEGYLKAYNTQSESSEKILPKVTKNKPVKLQKLNQKSHETKSPARYTEASLIKELEAKGIGRPSTYASIIDTILRRNYVYKQNKMLIPTFIAFAVIKLLETHFTNLIDMQFTANMEEELDAISRGEIESLNYLKKFYFGEKELEGLTNLITADIDAKEICTMPINDSSINIRVGKFGPYLEDGENKASIPDNIEPDQLTEEKAIEILKNHANQSSNEEIGLDPHTKLPVFVKIGRFGPYVQLGTEKPDLKIKSVPTHLDPATLDLETAIKIVSLPSKIGVFPDTETDIIADIGRFGPYLKAGVDTRSVSAEQILDLTEQQAIEILRTPKQRGRRGQTSLKEFNDSNIKILKGKYGPYITDGKINASVPRNLEVNEISLEKAQEILNKKANA